MMEQVIKNFDIKSFEEAFHRMQPGDKVIYHTGRELSGYSGLYAHHLYANGLVCLVQRRSKEKASTFEYMAIRTKKHRAERVKFTASYARPHAE